MALSSDFKKSQPIEDLEEVLDTLEKLLDRTKIMFEQYFMGIQKVAPMQLHRDVERKIRELTQQQIRNTGLRFRFTTMCQKFGAYNTYWKRTLREIEQGRYVRDLQRVKRKVEQNGEDLPEELLVKLPKLVQDRIRRERARLARSQAAAGGVDLTELEQASIAFSPRPAVHEISEEDTLFDDDDIDNLFGSVREHSVAAPLPEPEPPPKPVAAPPKPVAAPPKPVVPPRPIVPAAVTQKLKTMTPATGVPSKPTGPVVPPPLRPAAPPPAIPIPRPAAAPPPAAAKPAPPAARPAPVAPPPSPPVPPGMTEKQCRELHARYSKARELVGDRSEVSYDKLLATLGKQAPAIMKEHGAKGVDFQVVVRGDKVILKAKPVK